MKARKDVESLVYCWWFAFGQLAVVAAPLPHVASGALMPIYCPHGPPRSRPHVNQYGAVYGGWVRLLAQRPYLRWTDGICTRIRGHLGPMEGRP